MKNVALGVVIILVGIIAAVTVITITGTMNREVEMEDSLQIAVKKSVEACTTRHNYQLQNDQQFIADLLMELSNEVENDSDLQIDIKGADKDKGLLSLRVTEHYTSATGQDRTAVCDTTVILDKGATANVVSDAKITFKDVDGSYLGEQSLTQGEPIKAPITPSRAGHTFNGWVNEETNTNVGTELGTAVKNETFVASYS